jgi:hypothetical protein
MSSDPEVFQRKFREAFESIEGMCTSIGDIV